MKCFYELLVADWILIAQPDTLICQDGDLPDFAYEYNFIGGTSFDLNDSMPLQYLRGEHSDNQTMNGGLSFRNRSRAVEMFDDKLFDHSNMAYLGSIEDHVWSKVANEKRPKRMEAALFSLNSCLSECLEIEGELRCPWGIHRANTCYMKTHSQRMIDHCPDIKNPQFSF